MMQLMWEQRQMQRISNWKEHLNQTLMHGKQVCADPTSRLKRKKSVQPLESHRAVRYALTAGADMRGDHCDARLSMLSFYTFSCHGGVTFEQAKRSLLGPL